MTTTSSLPGAAPEGAGAWMFNQALKCPMFHAKIAHMKVLSVDDARARFGAVCEEALAGEVIRLQLPNGALLELRPVPKPPPAAPLSDQELAACYEDSDWAVFENHCTSF